MALLEVKDLTVEFVTHESVVHAVNGVSLEISEEETLGLVGETGAGKTTTAMSILKLLSDRTGRYAGGEILFRGEDILSIDDKALRKVRGNQISMIFQDSMTALNPTMPVIDQIKECIEIHREQDGKKALSSEETDRQAEEILEMVGIPPERGREFPHQYSGGMKQRVVIAMSLVCSPELLLADEPVSALDVSIQAQILNLLQDLQEARGFSYIFVTHDLSVVNHISDDILVMYLGCMVEKRSADDLFARQLHPYTKGLLSAIPIPSIRNKPKRIIMRGELFSPIDPKPGCRFASRCPFVKDSCLRKQTKLEEVFPGHFVACHQVREINQLD